MANIDKKVSAAVVRRLPRYYRYLSDLIKEGKVRISSKELSSRMGITASQVRQDLNCFGGFGQQGYGYNVEALHFEIANILGVDKGYKAIIIGAGNIGKALVNYPNFANRGFDIVGIFDVDQGIIGTKTGGLTVMDYKDAEAFIKNKRIDIAVITVPYAVTKKVATEIAAYGVKGIWNYSPMDLKLPGDVAIENVHLSDSLNILGYRIKTELH